MYCIFEFQGIQLRDWNPEAVWALRIDLFPLFRKGTPCSINRFLSYMASPTEAPSAGGMRQLIYAIDPLQLMVTWYEKHLAE